MSANRFDSSDLGVGGVIIREAVSVRLSISGLLSAVPGALVRSSMLRCLFGLCRVLCALLVSSFVLSAPLLWSQMTQPLEEIPTAEEIPARFFDYRIATWPFPETRTHPSTVQEGPPVSLEATTSQTGPRVRFFAPGAIDYRFVNSQTLSNPIKPSGTVEPLESSKYFTGSISGQWPKPVFSTHYPTMQATENVHNYASHFPWAAPIILRVSQEASKEARAHPHLTVVLKLFKPKF